MIQSIVHRWPLLSPIFRAVYESRFEKTGHLLKRFKNWSKFSTSSYYRKCWSARPCTINQNKWQSEGAVSGENDGWGRTSHFNVSKYVLTIFSHCIAAVCLSMLSSNALIAFNNDHLWLFQSVLTTHNTLHGADPTKYRVWPWIREYLVWPSTWKHERDIPMIFCAWDYHNEPIFRPQSLCDAEIPSFFVLQAAVHKQTPFNISRLQLVRHPISLFHNHSHIF